MIDTAWVTTSWISRAVKRINAECSESRPVADYRELMEAIVDPGPSPVPFHRVEAYLTFHWPPESAGIDNLTWDEFRRVVRLAWFYVSFDPCGQAFWEYATQVSGLPIRHGRVFPDTPARRRMLAKVQPSARMWQVITYFEQETARGNG